MRATRVLIPVCFALLAACSPRDGQAQPTFAEPNRAAPTDAASMKMSFAPVVQRTAPAVVNISAKRVVRQQVDPFWQLFGLVFAWSLRHGHAPGLAIYLAGGLLIGAFLLALATARQPVPAAAAAE